MAGKRYTTIFYIPPTFGSFWIWCNLSLEMTSVFNVTERLHCFLKSYLDRNVIFYSRNLKLYIKISLWSWSGMIADGVSVAGKLVWSSVSVCGMLASEARQLMAGLKLCGMLADPGLVNWWLVWGCVGCRLLWSSSPADGWSETVWDAAKWDSMKNMLKIYCFILNRRCKI